MNYQRKMVTRVGIFSFDPNQVLGEGSFGRVYRGLYSGSFQEKTVAVKRILKRHDVHESVILQEVELMKRAEDHPNILHVITTSTNDDFLFIVTELCSGTLEDYIKGTYEGARFQNEKEILRQVTQGLSYLHRLDIVHRDIKPTNILIFVADVYKAEPQMKLADFGLSRVLNFNAKDFTNTSVSNPMGTRGWMAPEVYHLNRFDFKVDIFPLGCIFGYTLSGGKHPFGDDDPDLRIGRIRQKKAMIMVENDLKCEARSVEAFKLIKAMLQMEPVNRPTADDVLNSPYFLVVDVQLNEFSMPLTKELLDICTSFEKSVTKEKVSQFVELVVERLVDVNALQRDKGINPIYIMIRYLSNQPNLIELVQLLILKGVDVNGKTLTKNSDNLTPLHALCEKYNLDDKLKIELVELLLLNGTDVNIKNKDGRSPFHTFCMHCRNQNLVDILRLMIQNGAQVNAWDFKGRTPLHDLCQYYRKNDLINIIRLLIESGADVNAKTNDGTTPLFFLCKNQVENEDLIEVIRLLIEKGADVNGGWYGYYTPLHALCEYYNRDERLLKEMVRLMMKKGADINAVDSISGKIPFIILRKRDIRM